MLSPALAFVLLAAAAGCITAASPTFKDCPITTGAHQLGLDGKPYASETGDFYVCPPCTYIQLMATAPFRCHLGVILDVICSDGSSPKRADGTEFNPLGYTVFSSPPPTLIVKSKNGFTGAFLKSTVVPKGSKEPLGKGFVERLDLVKPDGGVSTIGGVFLGAEDCVANFERTERSDRAVCGKGSKLVGIRGDSRSGPVFDVDFLCGRVASCPRVFQCPRA